MLAEVTGTGGAPNLIKGDLWGVIDL
jgi:hypothetical protein